jgi:tripartite ATP-independent transporter DctP family solute receptor
MQLVRIMALAGLVAGALAAGPAGAQQKITLKLGHVSNEQDVWHLASVRFGEELKALTNGAMEVQVFPNETLGKEMDLINGMQLGTVDLTVTGESLQNWAPTAALLAIPYALTSIETLDKVAGGAVGAKIAEEVIQKARVRPIAYFARGARNLTSNRPIKTPDDLNGFRMRVPNVPLFVSVWTALGARPTPMAFSEVFTSLQNNTIEGQENPLALIKAANFNEVQKYVNKTEHVLSWCYIVIGERRFSSLNKEQQAAVIEAGMRAQVYERQLFLAAEKKLEDELKAKGMTFVDVDKAAFVAKARPAALAGVKPEVKPLLEQMLAIQ